MELIRWGKDQGYQRQKTDNNEDGREREIAELKEMKELCKNYLAPSERI